MITEVVCRETGNTCSRFTTKCGMEVHLIPSSFVTTYAALGVRYGAFDTSLTDDVGYMEILPGSAHFLEHKMFDMPDGGDAFSMFAACGATANAYTSHEYTAYYFSCTENEVRALETLLDFVFHPHICQSGVDKEIGIIEQEIASYRDDSAYRAYITALSMMYGTHPIHIDIAGSKQDIQKISADDLNRIYRHFYRPDNMVLTIVGNIPRGTVERLINQICGAEPSGASSDRMVPCYDATECAHAETLQMDVATARAVMAYKNRHIDVGNEEEQGYYSDIAAACLFGRLSPLYREMYDMGYISRDFEGYYEWTWGAGHIILSFDTSEPDITVNKIKDYLLHITEHLPTREQFEEMRAVAYADAICVFDTVSDIALSDLEESMCGGDYYQIPGLIKNLSYEKFCQNLISIFENNLPFIVTVENK